MYLSNTNQSLEIVLAGNITTNQLRWTTSFQDITSAGMTLPQASDQNITSNTTPVTIVSAPAASTNRQVVLITVFNTDTVAATVTIQKDVAGTKYQLVRALLQVGDSLTWSRESGWTINKQSDQESVIITEFTANGTWTKRAGLKRVLVACVGAGGGGGSGRCDATNTNRFGGGGGGGGAVVWRQVAASDLASTVAVTIGTGGTGGTGVATVNTNGNSGNNGGDTSFGAIVLAKGGNGGGGGTASSSNSGTGGAPDFCNPSFGPYAMPGTQGGTGSSGNGSQGSGGFASSGTACPGGGGGGGINNTNVNATAGGRGGSVVQNGVSILGPLSGASPNGVANQSNFLLFSSSLTSGKGLGTGGAGGFPPSTAAGNGGLYGAGGGGGFASVTGTTSGVGGTGGGGLCLVMEIY